MKFWRSDDGSTPPLICQILTPHSPMKFGVLALDYDGTIATDGTLDSDVRVAIGDARANGIAVILVH